MDQNPPGEDCSQSAHDRAVQHVVKKDPARKTNEQGLNQKRYRSVRKRKIAVREIAEGNSVGIFQNVAEVPENRQPEILP